MRWLLAVFLITLFIPESVALQVGSLSLTPALVSAIFMFPALLSGKRIKFAWPDLVVVIFFVSIFYSMIASASIAESVETIGRRILSAGVPYLVGRYIGSRPEVFNTFMRRLMGVMAFFAIFLLFESMYRYNIHAKLWQQSYTPHPDLRLGLTRAYGWTSHSIMIGVSYAIFVPVMIIAAHERLTKLGGFRWLKVGLLSIGVFCSLSTGAWMPAAMAVGFVVWDYMRFIKPGTRWLIMSIGSLSTYIILEELSGRPLLRILMMKLHLSDPMAWYYRWMLYQRVYRVMPGYEWFGHGLVMPAYAANPWEWSIDNNYLVILMQFGRVGLVLWIAIGAAVLIYGWKAVWNAPDTPYRRIARAVMYAIVTVGLTQLSVALFSTAAMLYWLFLGLGIGMAQGLSAQRTLPGAKRRPNRPGNQAQRPPRAEAPDEPVIERAASEVQ